MIIPYIFIGLYYFIGSLYFSYIYSHKKKYKYLVFYLDIDNDDDHDYDHDTIELNNLTDDKKELIIKI